MKARMPTVAAHDRHRQQHPSHGPVRAQVALLDTVAGPGPDSGLVQELDVGGEIIRMGDLLEREPDQLGCVAAEQQAERRVDLDDAAVDADQRLPDRSGSKRLLEHLRGLRQLGFQPAPFGDIADGQQQTRDRIAFGGAHRPHVTLDRDPCAVRASEAVGQEHRPATIEQRCAPCPQLVDIAGMDELEDGMLEQLIRTPPEHPLHRPRHPRDTTIGPGPGDDVADIAQDHLVLLLAGRQLGQSAMLHRDVAHHRQRADPDTVLHGRGVGRLVHRKAVDALRDVDHGLATQCPLQQRPDPGKGARLQHLGHPAAEQACRVIPMHPRRAAQHGLIAHLRVDQQHTHERHRRHGRTHRPIGPAHDRFGPALPVHHHYPTVPTSGRGCRLDVYARRQTRVAQRGASWAGRSAVALAPRPAHGQGASAARALALIVGVRVEAAENLLIRAVSHDGGVAVLVVDGRQAPRTDHDAIRNYLPTRRIRRLRPEPLGRIGYTVRCWSRHALLSVHFSFGPPHSVGGPLVETQRPTRL